MCGKVGLGRLPMIGRECARSGRAAKPGTHSPMPEFAYLSDSRFLKVGPPAADTPWVVAGVLAVVVVALALGVLLR